MPDNPFERQIQELMNGLELQPDAAVWKNVKAQLQPASPKRRFAFWWWLGALLLAGVAGWWLYVSNSEQGTRNIEQGARNAAQSAANNEQAAGRMKQGSKPSTAAQEPGRPNDRQAAASAQPAAGNGQGAASGHQPATRSEQPVTSGSRQLSTGNERSASSAGHPSQPAANNPQPVTVSEQPVAASRPLSTTNPSTVTSEPTPQPAVYTPIYLSSYLPVNPLTYVNLSTDQLINPSAKQPPRPIALDSSSHQTVNSRAGQPGKHRYEWKTSLLVGAGMVSGIKETNSKAFPLAFSDYYSASPSNGTGGSNLNNSGSGSNTGNQVRYRPGFSWMIGLSFEKQMSRKWAFETGLYYRFVSSHTRFNYRDSSALGQSTAYVYTRQDVDYHVHAVGVPVIMHWQMTRPLGLSAGLLNEFTVAARGYIARDQGTSVKYNDYSITKQVNTYVPAAWFSLDIPWRLNQVHWRFSPYLQYGLNNTYQSSLGAGRSRLWQTGLKLTLRW